MSICFGRIVSGSCSKLKRSKLITNHAKSRLTLSGLNQHQHTRQLHVDHHHATGNQSSGGQSCTTSQTGDSGQRSLSRYDRNKSIRCHSTSSTLTSELRFDQPRDQLRPQLEIRSTSRRPDSSPSIPHHKDSELVSQIRHVTKLVTDVDQQRVSGMKEKKREYYQKTIPAPVPLLARLAKASQESSPSVRTSPSRSETQGYFLDEETVEEYAGLAGSNMWLDHTHGTCSVSLQRRRAAHRYHVKIGGPESTHKGIIESIKVPQTAENARWTTEIQSKHSAGLYVDLLEVPQPPVWTVGSLFRYIEVITTLPKATSAMRLHRPSPLDHRDQAVGDMLTDLYSFPFSKPFISVGSLVTSLRFCHKHTEMSKVAMKIWDISAESGIVPSIQCFNLELSRSLINRHLARFWELLSAMQILGIRPNKTTYAVCISWTYDSRCRDYFLKSAAELHKHDFVGDTNVVCAYIQRELPFYLQKPEEPTNARGQNFNHFIAYMDKRFGKDWADARALEKVFVVFKRCNVSKSMASQALHLMTRSAELGLLSDDKLYQILVHVMPYGLDMAVEVLLSNTALSQTQLHQDVLERLFHLASHEQSYNVCRLLWVYAALSGRLSRSMIRRVYLHWRHKEQIPSYGLDYWTQYAGRIILGVGNIHADVGKGTQSVQVGGNEFLDKEIFIAGKLELKLDDRNSTELNSVLDFLLERDLTAFMRYETIGMKRFQVLLKQAYEQDLIWKKESKILGLTPQQIFDNLLSINLNRLDQSQPVVDKLLLQKRRRTYEVNGKVVDFRKAILADDVEFAPWMEPPQDDE